MRKVLLVRFGEVYLKGLNRPTFLRMLVDRVRDAVKAVGYDGPACLELFRPEYWAMDAEDVVKMGAETTRPFL